MASPHMDIKNVGLGDGDRTTVALEPEFWDMLSKISKSRRLPLSVLIQEVEDARGSIPRAGALRLYVAGYFYQVAMERDSKLHAASDSHPPPQPTV